MNSSIQGPIDLCPADVAMVWFNGDVALAEGVAVCFNFDYGTATVAEAKRLNTVEVSTSLNAQFFAGTTNAAYTAVTGGQFIEINRPGSLCKILVAASTVVGVGLLTFSVDAATAGQFISVGLPGEGSATPMQTTTYVATAQLCLARLQQGPPSGGVENVTVVDNDAIGTLMIGGTTLITGATIGAGDCTYTLADGAVPGIRKKFKVITTEIATNDLVVTVSNGATDDVDDVVLATVTWAGAGTTVAQEITLVWDAAWLIIGRTKTTPAAA